jgi:pimeloyl-ACP methyl ester carboxylesterase
MPYLTISNSRLFYEDTGSGFPLLFGTSFLWDASMWAPQVETLSRSYRCIVPELWGHGRSGSIPSTPYSLDLLAEDMDDLTRQLGLDKYAVIGLSVGGMWAPRLALRRPDKVKALVMLDTFVGDEPKETQALYFGMLDVAEKLQKFPPPIIDKVVPMFFSPVTLQSDSPLPARFRTFLEAATPEQLPSIVALGRAIFSRPSILDRLGEIRCPTLFMVGEHDRPRPVHESQTMANLIPGSRVEIVPNAGHISNLENPEFVTGKIKKFLQNL